jgi:hypothetical protein
MFILFGENVIAACAVKHRSRCLCEAEVFASQDPAVISDKHAVAQGNSAFMEDGVMPKWRDLGQGGKHKRPQMRPRMWQYDAMIRPRLAHLPVANTAFVVDDVEIESARSPLSTGGTPRFGLNLLKDF